MRRGCAFADYEVIAPIYASHAEAKSPNEYSGRSSTCHIISSPPTEGISDPSDLLFYSNPAQIRHTADISNLWRSSPETLMTTPILFAQRGTSKFLSRSCYVGFNFA
jgi:hypothetical protein